MFIGRKSVEWTAHSKAKMRFYGLSEQRVLRIIHSPRRIEEGIAPKTIAMMQPASLKGLNNWTQEIWVMVQKIDQKSNLKNQNDNIKFKNAPTTKVISAWRYPGKTKPGDPLPAEILRELKNIL